MYSFKHKVENGLSEAYEWPNLQTNSCEFKCGELSESCTVEARKHEGKKALMVYDELLIIQSVLDNPSIYLQELQRRVEETTSTSVTESAICRFLHR